MSVMSFSPTEAGESLKSTPCNDSSISGTDESDDVLLRLVCSSRCSLRTSDVLLFGVAYSMTRQY